MYKLKLWNSIYCSIQVIISLSLSLSSQVCIFRFEFAWFLCVNRSAERKKCVYHDFDSIQLSISSCMRSTSMRFSFYYAISSDRVSIYILWIKSEPKSVQPAHDYLYISAHAWIDIFIHPSIPIHLYFMLNWQAFVRWTSILSCGLSPSSSASFVQWSFNHLVIHLAFIISFITSNIHTSTAQHTHTHRWRPRRVHRRRKEEKQREKKKLIAVL